MNKTSALKRRLQKAIQQYKDAKAQTSRTTTPIMLYDPDGVREASWINGPMPDGFTGTVFYLPYVDDDDDFKLVGPDTEQ